MAACPHCRQPTPPAGRVCPHCGLELPGRTRLGISSPTSRLGHTRFGPATEDFHSGPDDVGQAVSEPPVARRFESSPDDTWFGHQPVAELATEGDPVGPSEPQTRPPGAITRASAAPSAEEAWFHVRGPATPRPRPVRKAAHRPPSPGLQLGRTRIPVWALATAILAAGLAGAIVAKVLHAKPALSVIGFEVSADGRDLLTISCAGCEDGSTLTLGTARATLGGGVAQLASSELDVGENRLPIELVRPDGRTTTIPVTVSLAFRVTTDLAGLTEVPPFALVVVRAPRGTSVTIAGAPATAEPGVVRAKIDLSKDALGAERRAIEVHRKVPVRVLGPELERSTHATITARVVPLVLEREPTYDGGELLVTGRAGPGSRVLLLRGEQRLAEGTVDATGRFTLRARPHAAGPATVAATAPGHVSRQLTCTLPPRP